MECAEVSLDWTPPILHISPLAESSPVMANCVETGILRAKESNAVQIAAPPLGPSFYELASMKW